MNPGSSLLALERAGDNSQSVYIPMSPGPHLFDPLGYPATALPMHRGPSRGSEIQPPPVNRNLKPDRKGKSALSWSISGQRPGAVCIHLAMKWVLHFTCKEGVAPGAHTTPKSHTHTLTLQMHPLSDWLREKPGVQSGEDPGQATFRFLLCHLLMCE